MARYFLNSYKPLVCNKAGRRACADHDLNPFIDGSIRREPDLEHAHPSISCLCRADKFAPRLQLGDVVGYLTSRVRYGPGPAEKRLAAVLRVDRRFENHQDAANWFHDQGLPLPSNCMVGGNPPEPLSRSHCIHDGHIVSTEDARAHRRWDAGYRWRAEQYGVFLVCHADFVDVTENAPKVPNDYLLTAFGRRPGTQNPGSLPQEQFHRLLQLAGIDTPPSAR